MSLLTERGRARIVVGALIVAVLAGVGGIAAESSGPLGPANQPPGGTPRDWPLEVVFTETTYDPSSRLTWSFSAASWDHWTAQVSDAEGHIQDDRQPGSTRSFNREENVATIQSVVGDHSAWRPELAAEEYYTPSLFFGPGATSVPENRTAARSHLSSEQHAIADRLGLPRDRVESVASELTGDCEGQLRCVEGRYRTHVDVVFERELRMPLVVHVHTNDVLVETLEVLSITGTDR